MLGSRPSSKGITVGPDVDEHVLDAVECNRVRLSTSIAGAARRTLLAQDGLIAVADCELELGAFTDRELEAARVQIRFEVEEPSHPTQREPVGRRDNRSFMNQLSHL
jgi:hypothetical protein